MMNPFVVRSYVSKGLFCDREQELAGLLRNCENNADTTIISFRRMGKTGLIYRLFDEIKSRHLAMNPIYVDIYASRSLSDFIKFLSEAILKAYPEKSSVGKKFMTFIKSFRPLITFDPITGEPQLQMSYHSVEEKEYTLKGLFDFLEKSGVRTLLAIDEFQQIREYPEANMEELLRTYIQPLKHVNFIFCGSKKHMMTDIFVNAKKPFYSSTRFLMLDKIAADSYYAFIEHHFTENEQQIASEAIRYILEWTRRHTYYTQSLCNTVYAEKNKIITIDSVKKACLQILQHNEPVYLQYRQLLTDKQWNFLIAVAKEQEVKQITSQKFISGYGIGTPASAKRIVKALCDKELLIENVTKEGVTYSVYDVFFSRWLEREYS